MLLGCLGVGLVLGACNAIIGAEDRFLADVDSGPSGDATAPHPVRDGGDGGGGDGGDTRDATTPGDASAPSDASVDTGAPLSPYAAAITADKPVAWWRMDDPAGSTIAADELGLHPGAVSGGEVTFGVDGAVGKAMMLSGDGYLDVGNFFDLAPGQGYTLEAWVKSDWSNFQNVFEKRDGMNQGYVLYLRDGARLQYETFYDNESAGFATEDPDPSLLGTFVHVVVTGDGAGDVELYINGIETAGGNVFPSDAGVPFPIDRDLYLAEAVVGAVDEMALYDHALTAVQVGAHYAAGLERQ
jgi:hypothetical protein